MTPRHIVVASNPQASFGKNRAAGRDVARALGIAGHDVVALQEGDYQALEVAARAALRVDSVLVVVGGDGLYSFAGCGHNHAYLMCHSDVSPPPDCPADSTGILAPTKRQRR